MTDAFRFFNYVWARHPGALLFLLFWNVVMGMTEGAGIGLLVPMLSQLGFGQTTSELSQAIANWFSLLGVELSLINILLLILALGSFQAFSQVMYYRLLAKTQFEISSQVKRDLIESVFNAKWSFFLRARTGDLLSRLTAESDKISNCFDYFSLSISNTIMILVYLGVAFFINWKVAVIITVCGVVLATIMKKMVSVGAQKGKQASLLSNDLGAVVQDSLMAAKMIKASGTEQFSARYLKNKIDAVAEINVSSLKHAAFHRGVIEVLGLLLLLGTLYLAIVKFQMAGPEVLVLLFAFFRINPKATALQRIVHLFFMTLANFNNVMSAQKEALDEKESHSQTMTKLDWQVIRANQLGFTYKSTSLNVLKNISFQIAKGQRVAFVGPSGSGKTTLVDILLGLHTPTSGQLMVGDQVLTSDRLEAWRSQIGYVSQDTLLVNDTFIRNIAWGDLQPDIERVKICAQLALAEDFILEKENGYHAKVGERGQSLSGGQRQRLALARALYRQPEVLILDEATSALDSQSESMIQKAIEGLAGKITIIEIAHRLSTVKHADSIYVLKDGELIQNGQFETLSQSPGVFQELWKLQNIGH